MMINHPNHQDAPKSRSIKPTSTHLYFTSFPAMPTTRTTTQTCSICLNRLSPTTHAILLPCTHSTFHATCINPWLSHNPTCPICRSFTPAYILPDSSICHVVNPDDLCLCGVAHEVCDECLRRHHDPEECEWLSREEERDGEWVPRSSFSSSSDEEEETEVVVKEKKKKGKKRRRRVFKPPEDPEESLEESDGDDVDEDPDWRRSRRW
ncbi:hypothetical protein K440DRAFT_662338 [Wilcoxina mikolae CBS 423.85]|nr:hypothetical protein K440DRAFT_662338 [Wilcoxina mikolae CBS 423.85]